jgi:hypothetical protein
MLQTIMTVILLITAGFFLVMITSIVKSAQRRAKIKHEHDREPFTDGRR